MIYEWNKKTFDSFFAFLFSFSILINTIWLVIYSRNGILDRITSKVLDKILQFHFPLCFDVGAVHVCVEEDDGKCQDEDCVWVLKLTDKRRVAHAVSLAARQKEGHTHVELSNAEKSRQGEMKAKATWRPLPISPPSGLHPEP